MAKNLDISVLLDFYGDMLTEKQREVVQFYYNEDLSLAEIAEHSAITRQGVRDSIKRAESQLLDYEEKLGLYSRFVKIRDGLERIIKTAGDLNAYLSQNSEAAEKVQEIISIANDLNDEE
ncbi:MAG: putative DNA-binding protein [Oscillospiraceae bacterium]|nr:putative DNA-binding protein [Oscillospiraceae bacterium]